MGKASGIKARMRATHYLVGVEYCDGSRELNGFATREQAMRMVGIVKAMIDSDDVDQEGVESVELIERASGAVEFRHSRPWPVGVRIALAASGAVGGLRHG